MTSRFDRSPARSARAVPAFVCALVVMLCSVLVPGSAHAEDGGGRLYLAVDSMQPRVVTGTSGKLVVSGSVTNTGDRKVSDIALRLQVADPVRSEHQLMTAMAKPPVTALYKSGFHQLRRQLEPGQSTRFRVSVDLHTSSLKLPTAGIYPLTVNVNGRPDYGGDARLASLNTLLPVSSPPGQLSFKSAPNPGKSSGFTMLWPFAGTPSQLGRTPSGKPIMADDSLAVALRQGGRLSALLDGARRILVDQSLRQSTCFAVDPELVQAVAGMRGGYQVRTSDGTVAGTGAQAARQWLAGLAEVTKGRCVVPLPYAQADLVALARAGAVDLEQQALGVSILHEYLPGAQLHDEIAVPDAGMLDARTMSDLTGMDKKTAVVSPANIGKGTGTDIQAVSGLESGGKDRPKAITTDALLTRALRGQAIKAEDGALTPASTPAVASENGIAALVYRDQFDPDPPKRMLVVPPARWNTSAEDVKAWLDMVDEVLSDGTANPVPPSTLFSAESNQPPSSLHYPPSAAAAETPRSVTAKVTEDNTEIRDLRGALSKDSAGSTAPEEAITGLQQGLLRATSGAWRGNDDAARTAAREGTNRLRAFTERVRVSSSGLPLSLASKDSQIPVAVSNELPVNVTVRIYLESPGLRDDQRYTEKRIPAHNSRTVLIPVKVQRSGRFNVDIKLTTPGQTPLGKPTRVDVSSSAFGMVTVAITITAFVALILLAGRRIYRRIRAARTSATASGSK
ncbi:DUF6049 family protein [Sciscionella sediminilitoris]|uniref:DUF6049 family protein n=1 Tax=Sciscionella sediminilitoris TaxID=1445613 RepID=UPI0012E1E977|nr:DUF6049 family protein [Sciscionella sp. SE31]